MRKGRKKEVQQNNYALKNNDDNNHIASHCYLINGPFHQTQGESFHDEILDFVDGQTGLVADLLEAHRAIVGRALTKRAFPFHVHSQVT